MPSTDQHFAQVQHNRAVIAALDADQPTYRDWVITVAFYAALHLIEAWFAEEQGSHYETHRDRQDAMYKVRVFKPQIYNLYRNFEDLSRRARYKCVSFTENEVKYHALGRLDTIEMEIRRLLGR